MELSKQVLDIAIRARTRRTETLNDDLQKLTKLLDNYTPYGEFARLFIGIHFFRAYSSVVVVVVLLLYSKKQNAFFSCHCHDVLCMALNEQMSNQKATKASSSLEIPSNES